MENQNQFGLLEVILNQIKIDDPALKQLIERQIRDKHQNEEISKEIIRRLRIQNKKLLEQITSLREQLKQKNIERNRATDKLNTLLKLNNSLAEALGSCNTCWGEDPACTNCSGEGSPGWQNIKKRLFNLYVLPSLEKLYGQQDE